MQIPIANRIPANCGRPNCASVLFPIGELGAGVVLVEGTGGSPVRPGEAQLGVYKDGGHRAWSDRKLAIVRGTPREWANGNDLHDTYSEAIW